MANPIVGGNTWDRQIAEDGAFVRHQTGFRGAIRADGSTEFPPERDRYHLYVSYACPWAHRTLMARLLKGLEEVVTVDVVHPILPRSGWTFEKGFAGTTGDRVQGFQSLREAYDASRPGYEGVVTVPVLWDKKTRRIVSNESSEILRMLGGELDALATHPEVDLYPEAHRAEIDAVNDWVYSAINDGVYQCGFARTQAAYGRAFHKLFDALNRAESILAKSRYLVGNRFTEADLRLFATLVRFDAVYATHFKCNLRRVVDYPNLHGFTRDIYQTDRIAETVHLEHIKRHYFESHRHLNPLGIVPEGPHLDFDAPHGREDLGPARAD